MLGLIGGLFGIASSIFGLSAREKEANEREYQQRQEQQALARERAYQLDVAAANTYASGISGSASQAEIEHRQSVVSARNNLEVARIESERDIAGSRNVAGFLGNLVTSGISNIFSTSALDEKVFKSLFNENDRHIIKLDNTARGLPIPPPPKIDNQRTSALTRFEKPGASLIVPERKPLITVNRSDLLGSTINAARRVAKSVVSGIDSFFH